MKKLTLALVLLWPLAGLADSNAAHDAYQRGDYGTALREFRRLADAGDAVAQYNLGLMYRRGQGVAADDVKALNWHLLAAEQGHTGAQATMYGNGEGAPQNDVRAYAWLNLAAAKGTADGAVDKAQGVRQRLGKRMTPTQIAEAQKLRRELCARIPNCVP